MPYKDPSRLLQYLTDNRERLLARARKNTARNRLANLWFKRTWKSQMVQRVINFFGGKCAVCGATDSRCFNVDHISGGHTRIAKLNGTQRTWQAYATLIRRNPEEAKRTLRLLCANCNFIKRISHESTRRPEDTLSLKVLRERGYHQKARAHILAFLGNKCCKCGYEDVRALQIDHIRSNGASERKVNGSTNLTFVISRMIRSNPQQARESYQLLCASCNWIKRSTDRQVAARRRRRLRIALAEDLCQKLQLCLFKSEEN